MRFVFDENTPKAVALAVAILVEADNAGSAEPVEVLHALDVVDKGTKDVPLIQAVAGNSTGKAILITSDKAMRTRAHERAAFTDTGCIGIVLHGQWSHASLWDRAMKSLLWWPAWHETALSARPGSLWRSPWSNKPKRLQTF